MLDMNKASFLKNLKAGDHIAIHDMRTIPSKAVFATYTGTGFIADHVVAINPCHLIYVDARDKICRVTKEGKLISSRRRLPEFAVKY